MNERIGIISPLRGVGAICIMLFHLKFQLPRLNDAVSEHTQLLEHSYIWLDFFFVLSGYILTHAHGGVFSEGLTLPRYRRFVSARFARIYPLHFVVLLLMFSTHVALYLGHGTPIFSAPFFTADSLFTNLLLIQSLNLHPAPTWNLPAWAISAQWWAYMSFPLFVAALLRCRTRTAAAVLVLTCMALYQLYAAHGTLDISAQNGVFRCGLEFVIGCCIYRLRKARSAELLAGDGAMTVLMLLLVAAMHSQSFPGGDPIMVTLMALLIVAASKNAGRWSRFLESKAPVYLGEISYSIYLLHFPIEELGKRTIAHLFDRPFFGTILPIPYSIALVGLYLVVVLLVAHLSHRYFEKPCRDYIRRRSGID